MSIRATRRLLAVAAVVVAVVNTILAAGSNFLSLSAEAIVHGPRRARLIDQSQLRELHRLGEARFVLLLAALTLLAAVPGLLRGRRAAWWTTLAATIASIGGYALHQLHDVGLVLLLVLLAMLLGSHARFTARANPARITQGLTTIAIGLSLVFVYGAVGVYFLDANFRKSTTVVESLYESARLVLLLPTAVLEPTTGHGLWFIDSIRVLAVVVIVAGLIRALAPATIGPSIHAAAREHAQRLLEQYGRSSLAPFDLLDDKTWFFAGDGEAVLSYRLVGSVAVVLGAPVGAPESTTRGLREFLTHCVDSGWTPVFHQVGDTDRTLLEGAGLRLLKIGEEAIVPLDEFSLEGSDMKSLRSTLKRVERVGCRFEVLDEAIDDATMVALREVSDSWMTASSHRERTFTVGRFDPAYLRSTTVAVVRDADGRIVAFANILPTYQSREGNFDLMRRRPDSVNGVMEFLFVSLIRHFHDAGLEGMNIGLAPLAGVDGDGVTSRVLCAVRDHAGSFNFDGLRAFKEKWRPRWESRYIAYEREVDLPRVAVGITRAGELDPPRPERRVVSLAKRYPFSLAMVGLTLWFSIATDLDPRFQRVLHGQLGLSYPALTRLEAWRLVTAPVTEARAGFVWATFVVVLIVLPVAERRMGTRRTAAGFFAGALAASVPALLVLAVVGDGRHMAVAHALVHSASPATGCWALVLALVFTLATPRRRWLAAVAAFGVLIVGLVVVPHVGSAGRIASASVGAGLGWSWSRRQSARGRTPGSATRKGRMSAPAGRVPAAVEESRIRA